MSSQPGLLAGRRPQPRAAQGRLATQLRREAPPGDGESQGADALGDRMDGPRAGAESPTQSWGKGVGRCRGDGELKSSTGMGVRIGLSFSVVRRGAGRGRLTTDHREVGSR